VLTRLFLSSGLTKEARSQTRVVGVPAELLLRCIGGGGGGFFLLLCGVFYLHGVRGKGLQFRSSVQACHYHSRADFLIVCMGFTLFICGGIWALSR
jgi:hypothetical protein